MKAKHMRSLRKRELTSSESQLRVDFGARAGNFRLRTLWVAGGRPQFHLQRRCELPEPTLCDALFSNHGSHPARPVKSNA